MNEREHLLMQVQLLEIEVRLIELGRLMEFNPKHDQRGRFASGGGGGGGAAGGGGGGAKGGSKPADGDADNPIGTWEGQAPTEGKWYKNKANDALMRREGERHVEIRPQQFGKSTEYQLSFEEKGKVGLMVTRNGLPIPKSKGEALDLANDFFGGGDWVSQGAYLNFVRTGEWVE